MLVSLCKNLPNQPRHNHRHTTFHIRVSSTAYVSTLLCVSIAWRFKRFVKSAWSSKIVVLLFTRIYTHMYQCCYKHLSAHSYRHIFMPISLPLCACCRIWQFLSATPCDFTTINCRNGVHCSHLMCVKIDFFSFTNWVAFRAILMAWFKRNDQFNASNNGAY